MFKWLINIYTYIYTQTHKKTSGLDFVNIQLPQLQSTVFFNSKCFMQVSIGTCGTLWVPMTWTCVLAVMLVATLVATHSHSPWSSLVRDLNFKLPRGRTLCLLLLGFPTCSPASQANTDSQGERRGEWSKIVWNTQSKL